MTSIHKRLSKPADFQRQTASLPVRQQRGHLQRELLKISRAQTLSPADVLTLQRTIGNRAVSRLLAAQIRCDMDTIQRQEAAQAGSLGGIPYRGSRKVNETMDAFETKKNEFGAPIFKRFVEDWSLWEPLYDYIKQYWANFGNQHGITLSEGDVAAAESFMAQRLSPTEKQVVDEEIKTAGKAKALLNALFVEFRKAYPACYRKANDAWLASDFRLDHEFYAAYFKMVEPGFKYWAKP